MQKLFSPYAFGKNLGRNWEHYGNDMGNKCVYNNSIQYCTLVEALANVAKVVKFFDNILAVTRQTKHVIIVLSKIATKRRGNQMAFSLSKVVKIFGSTLPMTENELCAIIVPSKIAAVGF